MTIELIAEQKINEEKPRYYIYLNGTYVDGSLTYDLDVANAYYQRVCNNPAIVNNSKIILKSDEIVVSSRDTKQQ